MEYCAPLGIPHSELLKWDRSDVDKAISFTAWKAKFCPQCGTDPAEWLDEDGRAVEPPPYVGDTRVCLGCATLEEERAKVPKDAGHRYTSFLRKASPKDFEQWQMRPSVLD
jgi:hypothetical protein